MLLQFHQTDSNGVVHFVAQKDFTDGTPAEDRPEVREWIEQVRKEYPLKRGCGWILHKEPSGGFLLIREYPPEN